MAATVTVATPAPTPVPPATGSPLAPVVGLATVTGAGDSESYILSVPFRSQYDNSPYQLANCGPAALGMVLQAYGLDVSNQRLRDIADQLQGTTGYNDGVALDYLQLIAQQAGLRTEGLKDVNGHYRQWSMADVILEIRRGNPVITLVHYAALPDHTGSTSPSDHYVVVVGVTSQGFVINDPAFTGDGGYHRLLRPDQLLTAWHDASIPEQAVAFLPPEGQVGLGPTVPGAQLPQGLLAIPTAVATATAPAAAPPTWVAPAVGRPPAVPRAVRSAPLAPPPAPTFAAWAINLSDWNHTAPLPTIQPAAPTSGNPAGETLVLADRSSGGAATVPILAVIGFVTLVALVILRSPHEDADPWADVAPDHGFSRPSRFDEDDNR